MLLTKASGESSYFPDMTITRHIFEVPPQERTLQIVPALLDILGRDRDFGPGDVHIPTPLSDPAKELIQQVEGVETSLFAYLESGDATVRLGAVKALGILDAKMNGVPEALATVTGDPVPDVRQAAAYIIEKLIRARSQDDRMELSDRDGIVHPLLSALDSDPSWTLVCHSLLHAAGDRPGTRRSRP